MSAAGEVITFYSYKGGAGRSMALANVATLLAQKEDCEVLVMDWDLEAPGLQRFFADVDDRRLGTIDLMEKAWTQIQGYAGSELSEEASAKLMAELDLDSYIQPLGASSVSLLRAGSPEEETYASRVANFPWERLYMRAPYLFKSLATSLTEKYRYVLIDSRTGLSDTSGICTALLPEKLVLVFTPNRQSLDGVLERARAAIAYRRQADDLRPLLIYPLASRVELSEDELRRRWRHGEKASAQKGYQPAFEQLLAKLYGLEECDLQAWFDEVQIQHAPRYAYGESIAVVEEGAASDRLSLANSYVRFAAALDRGMPAWSLAPAAHQSYADASQELHTLDQLAGEYEWHRYRANAGRVRLLMLRGLQLAVAATAAILALEIASQYPSYLTPIFASAAVVFVLIEAFVTILGAGQWRRHAAMAAELAEERNRYETRTRQYKDPEAGSSVLAERIDEILESNYKSWKVSGPLSSLAPMPQRRDDLPRDRRSV